jgi:hypothetical protein
MVRDGVVADVGGDDSLLEGHERGTRNLKIEQNIQVICRFKWKAQFRGAGCSRASPSSARGSNVGAQVEALVGLEKQASRQSGLHQG